MIADLLHAGAVASSALSVCCVAVQGRPGAAAPRRALHRAREFVVAFSMLVAMIGASAGGAGSAVAWSGAIVALAFGSLLFGSRAASSERGMIAYDALGAVTMAALMLVMGASGSGAYAVAGSVEAGHHGSAPLVLAIVLGVATLAYAGVSAFLVATARDLVGALRPLAMGGSVLLMGCGVLAAGVSP